MAYIGTKPTVGNFQICDAISVVNGQAAYTMQVGSVNVVPQSANHMIVSLNGTIQKPNSSFTVSGSTITFASNLATGDVIDFIQILGDVLDLGVPSDATVTTAKLASDIGISTTGNIATTSSGTITSAGLITASSGVSIANNNALKINDTSSAKEILKVDNFNQTILKNANDSRDIIVRNAADDDIVRLRQSGGIAIGGTGDANTLDDYEEGTWTPQIKISGSTTGITYNEQGGHYTKIGNRVIANAEIYLSSKGSNTGNVSIINLPFTTSNDNHQTAHVYNDRVSSSNGDVQGYIPSNATTVSLYQSRTDGSNNGNITGNEMNNTSYLLLLMAYKTG